MTYHPRFEAMGEHRTVYVPGAATELQTPHLEGTVNLPSGAAAPPPHLRCDTVEGRSAAAELSVAHAELARLFPDESFSLGCVAAGARAAKIVAGLLTAFAALLGTILVRSIA